MSAHDAIPRWVLKKSLISSMVFSFAIGGAFQ
jgi:hypothetical protein